MDNGKTDEESESEQIKPENEIETQGKTRKVNTLYLVMIALLTAMTFVGTMVIQIPAGVGYVNFGDSIIMTSGIVLGPVGAMIAGALGAAIADMATGYMVYAPFTLIIKGLEGFVCGLVFKSLLKGRNKYLRAIVAFLISAVIVVVGYMLADFLLVLFGFIPSEGGNVGTVAVAAAIATVPSSLLQVAVSVVIAEIAAPKLPTLSLMNKNKNRE